MIPNSNRAVSSRACTSLIALAAITASAALAGPRVDSRPSHQPAITSRPSSELLSLGNRAYRARLLNADGTPITSEIGIHAMGGEFVAKVQPDANGVFSLTGTAGQIFGLTYANADLTTLGVPSAKVLLPDSNGAVVDINLAGQGGGNQIHAVAGSHGLGQLDPSVIGAGGPVALVGGTSCDTATAIAVPGTDSGSTVGAAVGFAGAADCSGGAAGGSPVVWYTLTGNGNMITVSLCGSGYDTVLNAYRQCGATCSGSTLTCVANNDDFCGLQSQVSFASAAGVTYKIAVSGFLGSTGSYVINTASGAPATGITCPLPTGACCITTVPPFAQNQVPVSCSLKTQPDCVAAGGTYHGDDVPCVTGTLAFAEYDDIANAPIADGGFGFPNPGPPTVRTISVVNPGIVADVNVEIDVQHPFNADLNLFIDHNSVSNRLWNNVCGGANLHYTSDEAGTEIFCAPIETGLADTDGDGYNSDEPRNNPTVGMFNGAAENLDEYNGMDSTGAWNFTAVDDWAFDTGVLQHWGLELTTLTNTVDACPAFNCANSAPCEDPSGFTLICHIPPGNPANMHEIRVSNSAVRAHLNHGDICGPCNP